MERMGSRIARNHRESFVTTRSEMTISRLAGVATGKANSFQAMEEMKMMAGSNQRNSLII